VHLSFLRVQGARAQAHIRSSQLWLQRAVCAPYRAADKPMYFTIGNAHSAFHVRRQASILQFVRFDTVETERSSVLLLQDCHLESAGTANALQHLPVWRGTIEFKNSIGSKKSPVDCNLLAEMVPTSYTRWEFRQGSNSVGKARLDAIRAAVNKRRQELGPAPVVVSSSAQLTQRHATMPA
jgi:hypothetical protein